MDVERDEIAIATVEAAFMANAETAYVRLGDFSETSNEELSRALADLDEIGFSRLVLDLRGNPGGPLDQAIKVSNQFLPRGDMIVYTRGRVANSDQDYHARDEGLYIEQPLVVLVNRNSASASEIVAGALKDNKRAILIGENSYGKGSVQSIIPLRNGGGMRLTISKYYLPSGKSISEVGVSPDIVVEESVDENFKFNTETDNQLKFALKLLNG